MLAILFAALTFASAGPHEHNRLGKVGHEAAVAAASGNIVTPSLCPLCERSTAVYVLPTFAVAPPAPLGTPPSINPTYRRESPFHPLVLYRNLRAPPLNS